VDLGSPRQATPEQVVRQVVSLRDALDLPRRLRELLDEGQLDVQATAEFIRSDTTIDKVHPSLLPTVDEIAEVLHRAW
jgi:predicted component of type VI protein secretion system